MSVKSAVWQQLLGLAVSSACFFIANCATAQITPDRTLPNNSSVTINGSTFNITGGTQAGRNLFHSFQQFSVPTGGTASFNNGLDIQNIFSRVTGGTISNIDGIIKANGTANLFFLNPNLIVFGKNASLNVGGSFVATTANAIQFGNQGTFSASEPNNPALLTVNPTALFYNQIAAGTSIQNNSQASVNGFVTGLQVPDGKSLLLVGGDVVLNSGKLNASGGRVELGGLATPGTVGLQSNNGNDLSLNFPANVQRADVSVGNGASVNVSAGGGGNIVVNASNLNITGGSQLSVGNGNSLNVNASKSIQISGTGSGLLTQTESNTTGNAGYLTITTPMLSVQGGAQVLSDTLGAGKGGNLNITASNLVQLSGAGSRLLAQTESNATGNAGDLTITTPILNVENGAHVSAITLGAGKGGNVNVNASNQVQLSGTDSGLFAQSNATGNAGDLTITTPMLSVQGGAQVLSDTLGAGKGGNLNITASNLVQLSGAGSRLLAQTESNATGNAGDLTITTPILNVENGAHVSAITLGAGKGGNVNVNASNQVQLSGTDSGLFAQSNATGNAGDLTITTPILRIKNGAQVSAGILGAGKGGNVNVDASDQIQLLGRSADGQFASGLFAQAEKNATGNAGNLKITTPILRIEDGAQVSSGTLGAGKGGNVNVDASDQIQLLGRSADGQFASGLFAQAEKNATGNAGDLKITTPILRIENGAQVSSGTLGAGKGGNVNVDASDQIQLLGRSADGQFASGLFAQAEKNATGNAGNLKITTPELLVQDGAVVSVLSQGKGNAGNLSVNAHSIRLDNGTLSGNTSSNNADPNLEQASITVRSGDLILSLGSKITTNATGTNVVGGNINVDTDVLAAVENSHISANSADYRGGKVTINTQGIFLSPESTITATGANNQLNGAVQIISPDIDPARGLITLPTVTENPPKLVSSNCTAFNEVAGGNSFTITGRGGLPPSPYEPLASDAIWTDTRLPLTTAHQHQPEKHAAKIKPKPIEIVPATGWVFNGKGEVTLISSVSNTTSSTPTSCLAR